MIELKRDGLVGKPEDAVVEAHGAPNRIEKAGTYTIYWYQLARSVQTHSRSSASAWNNVAWGSSRGSIEETTHSLRFYFKDGVCTKWDERVDN